MIVLRAIIKNKSQIFQVITSTHERGSSGSNKVDPEILIACERAAADRNRNNVCDPASHRSIKLIKEVTKLLV
jgi:hypothetical protein